MNQMEKYFAKKKLAKQVAAEKRGFSWALTEYLNGDMCIGDIQSEIDVVFDRTEFDRGAERACRLLYARGLVSHTDMLFIK